MNIPIQSWPGYTAAMATGSTWTSEKTMKRESMTISPENLARMAATADLLGEHFAKEDDREVVLLWLDMARRELVEECDPVDHPEIRTQLDAIDSVLDRIESRRAEVRAAH
jgi:hypothetical protein